MELMPNYGRLIKTINAIIRDTLYLNSDPQIITTINYDDTAIFTG
jgi:hypothetical protein